MTDQTKPSFLKLFMQSRWRKLFAAIGLCLVCISISVEFVGLSTAAGFGRNQLMIAFVGVLVTLIGVLGPQIPSIYRASAIILLNSIVFLVAIELGLRGIDAAQSWLILRQSQGEVTEELAPFLSDDARWNYYSFVAKLPYYQGQTWTAQFIQDWESWELGGSSIRFYPYTMWRSSPFRSATINIGDNRLRNTPGAECTSDAYQVYMFGGSVMQGFGSPDDGTVAAFMQMKLAEHHDGPVCVRNFGQLGYVSTQNLIELMGELQHGRLPDEVIFLDGINEVRAANRVGAAYSPVPEFDFAFTIEGQHNATIVSLLESSKIFQTITASPENSPQNYSTMGVAKDVLAADVIENYFGVYWLVQGLASVYGFDYYLFWQPVIYAGNKPLTPVEELMRSGNSPEFIELFEAVYHRMIDLMPEDEHLYDISDVFNRYEEQLYIDYMHVTPIGNEIITQRIFEIVEAN